MSAKSTIVISENGIREVRNQTEEEDNFFDDTKKCYFIDFLTFMRVKHNLIYCIFIQYLENKVVDVFELRNSLVHLENFDVVKSINTLADDWDNYLKYLVLCQEEDKETIEMFEKYNNCIICEEYCNVYNIIPLHNGDIICKNCFFENLDQEGGVFPCPDCGEDIVQQLIEKKLVNKEDKEYIASRDVERKEEASEDLSEGSVPKLRQQEQKEVEEKIKNIAFLKVIKENNEKEK